MAEKKGWETAEVARHYAKIAELLIPNRAEILATIAGLVAEFTPQRPKILDIGCGHGDVTGAVLSARPAAALTLVDYSDDMIAQAQERFAGNQNVNIIQHDLNKGLPVDIMTSDYDAVVSCFALHHIEFENRVRLYENIRKVLRKGGLFINGDRFVQEAPPLDGWAFDSYIAWTKERIKAKLDMERSFDEVKERQLESDKKLGDKPATIWAMREDLKKAGFGYVDCVHMQPNLSLGILVASE